MASDVKVLLLRTAGTNCDRELAHAFTLAGAQTSAIHINALLANPSILEGFQILGFPGGFSYGDDIASGKILANQIIHHLRKPLGEFVHSGKMIVGICNGFQVLVKSGLLPGPLPQIDVNDWHPTTLTYNNSGKFEDRWVQIRSESAHCKWIAKGVTMALPVAHGEGRFVVREEKIMAAIKENDQIVFKYVDDKGLPAVDFPSNPNGSAESIAGICDITGRVLGLMPHPERICDGLTHPTWTRGGAAAEGLKIFETAVEYVRSQMTVHV